MHSVGVHGPGKQVASEAFGQLQTVLVSSVSHSKRLVSAGLIARDLGSVASLKTGTECYLKD